MTTRRRFPGGTPAQQYSFLLTRLAWVALPTPEYLVWRNGTPAERRRRRGDIWQRFVEQRDNPATRPALINRLAFVSENPEFVTLLGLTRIGALETVLPPALPRQPRWQWGGPWGRPWRRPSGLAWALAGIGVENLQPLPRDLANIIAGVNGDDRGGCHD
jgi:hypothetical protein